MQENPESNRSGRSIVGLYFSTKDENGAYSFGRIVNQVAEQQGHYLIEVIQSRREQRKFPKRLLVSSFETIHLNALLFESLRELRRYEKIVDNRY